MDSISFVTAQVLQGVDFLHQNGAISSETHSSIIANLLQVNRDDQETPVTPTTLAPPVEEPILKVPVKKKSFLSLSRTKDPVASTSSLPPPSPTTHARAPTLAVGAVEPVAANEDVPKRGHVNQAIYDAWGDGKRIGETLNSILKLMPLLDKSDRHAIVKTLEHPFGKGVDRLTRPDLQASARRTASESLLTVGRKVKEMGRRSGRTTPTPLEDEEDSRFVRSTTEVIEVAPGLSLEVTTRLRVLLDEEMLLAAGKEVID